VQPAFPEEFNAPSLFWRGYNARGHDGSLMPFRLPIIMEREVFQAGRIPETDPVTGIQAADFELDVNWSAHPWKAGSLDYRIFGGN
jgi:hypothetical protein